jgi:hypothetical protein
MECCSHDKSVDSASSIATVILTSRDCVTVSPGGATFEPVRPMRPATPQQQQQQQPQAGGGPRTEISLNRVSAAASASAAAAAAAQDEAGTEVRW